MDASVLERLQNWYLSQCNNDWEHQYGVKVDTLDNPGWTIRIDLAGTSLAEKDLPEHKESYEDEQNWFVCKKEKKQFVGNGGPKQLSAMIEYFLNWAGH